MTRKEEIWNQALMSHKNCYDDYVNGAEWADKHPRKDLIDIDEACKWIGTHLLGPGMGEYIDEFKKDMLEV